MYMYVYIYIYIYTYAYIHYTNSERPSFQVVGLVVPRPTRPLLFFMIANNHVHNVFITSFLLTIKWQRPLCDGSDFYRVTWTLDTPQSRCSRTYFSRRNAMRPRPLNVVHPLTTVIVLPLELNNRRPNAKYRAFVTLAAEKNTLHGVEAIVHKTSASL